MDPLSVAASIMGAGEAVSRGLSKLVAFRNAPDQLLQLRNEVIDLQLILGALGTETLDDSTNGSAVAARQKLYNTLDWVKEIMLELEKLLEPLLTKTADNGTKFNKVSWIRQEKAIRRLEEKMRSARNNLAAAVAITNMATPIRIELQLSELHVSSESVLRQGCSSPTPQDLQRHDAAPTVRPESASFDEAAINSEDDSEKLLRGTVGTYETLDPSFRMVKDYWQFFVPGRVFATLWWEPIGEEEHQLGPELVRYGERAYAKIRRFIVVRPKTKDYYSQCLQISTHGGRGATGKGLNQREHAIVYTGDNPPKKLEGESKLQKDAIQVIPVTPSEKLDPLSRLDLHRVYPVEHNLKVKEIGKVPATDLKVLIAAWKSIAKDDGSITRQFSEGFAKATEREAAELSLPNMSDAGSKNVMGNQQEKELTLHRAASTGNSISVRALLEAGAETEAKDDVGKTALHYAAERGYVTIAELLLNNAANIEAKDNAGRTALDLARNNLREGMELLLLEVGAKLESKNEKNLAALYQSVDNSHQVISEPPGPSLKPQSATDADLSEGSDADSVYSIESRLSSLSSQSSLYSYPELETAVEELTTLFFSDKVLGPMFLMALDNKSIGAERLENNFRRLLKQFSAELKVEAHSTLEHAAARLAGSKARQIAHNIRRIKQIEFEQQETPYLLTVPPSYKPGVDDEGHSSDEHEVEECAEEDITTLADVKAFITSSKAFCFLLHKFRRFVQPDVLQSICKEMESEVEVSRLADVTFQVHWDLLDYCKEELGGSPVFAPLLTVTGSPKTAYATTCEEYMNRYWPRSGPDTLKTLQAALGQEVYETQWPSGLRFSVDLSAWHKRSLEKHVTVKICGSQECVVEIAQQLAWLSAVFRVPKYDELTLSDVVLERIDDEHFKLFPLDLQPVSKKELSCWHPLFVNGVIARGFPIPPRQEEVGIELSFEVMTALSRVLYPMEYYDGIVLKGPSTVLIPTARYSGSVQWHFISSSTRDKRLPTASIKNHISDWFETCDFDLLRRARTFLGYCRNAEIHLGTHGLDYTGIKKSDAQSERPRLEFSRKLSASIGSSGLGFFGAMFGSEVVYPKGWHATTKSTDLYLEDRLLRAREQPLLLYDTEKKRGWLVPEISVVLHIVHAWAARQIDLSPSTIHNIPHATISTNGGMAAWDAIMEGKLLKIRPDGAEGKHQLFLDVVKSFLTALESRKEEIVTREDSSSSHPFRQPGLRGWDLLDIVTRRQFFRRKEASVVRKTGGKWDLLASENPELIVLFGEGIGEPIKPERHEKVCSTWTPVPEGKCYLTASVQCLEQLAAVHGGLGTCPKLAPCLKLTPRLHWHRPLEGSLFEDCEFGIGHGCDRLQRLKERNFKSPGPIEPNGAVIFGKMGKDSISCCEPLKRQPVRGNDEYEQNSLLSKQVSLGLEHTARNQVTISSYPITIQRPNNALHINQRTEQRKYSKGNKSVRIEGSNPNRPEDTSLSLGKADDITPKASLAIPYLNGEDCSGVQTEQPNKMFDTEAVASEVDKEAAYLAVGPIRKTLNITSSSQKDGKIPAYLENEPIPKTPAATPVPRKDGNRPGYFTKMHTTEKNDTSRTSLSSGKMVFPQSIARNNYHANALEANVIRKCPGLEDLKTRVT